MGTWGPGLYASDTAADLRSMIGAICKLPFDADRLLQILCQSWPTAATDPTDEEYTIFWLVAADQFHRRQINCRRARETALGIIDTGQDQGLMQQLGLNRAELTKRRRTLDQLRVKLSTPPVATKPRSTLKKPQPLVMNRGDLFIYPTSAGRCINSYFASESEIPGWRQDGWSAAIVIDCGRAFDYLAWYRPLTLSTAQPDKPDADSLLDERIWILRQPATCSRIHFRRLRLEQVASFALDPQRLANCFPDLPGGDLEAIHDIGLPNQLSVAAHQHRDPRDPPAEATFGLPTPSIAGLGQILGEQDR